MLVQLPRISTQPTPQLGRTTPPSLGQAPAPSAQPSWLRLSRRRARADCADSRRRADAHRRPSPSSSPTPAPSISMPDRPPDLPPQPRRRGRRRLAMRFLPRVQRERSGRNLEDPFVDGRERHARLHWFSGSVGRDLPTASMFVVSPAPPTRRSASSLSTRSAVTSKTSRTPTASMPTLRSDARSDAWAPTSSRASEAARACSTPCALVEQLPEPPDRSTASTSERGRRRERQERLVPRVQRERLPQHRDDLVVAGRRSPRAASRRGVDWVCLATAATRSSSTAAPPTRRSASSSSTRSAATSRLLRAVRRPHVRQRRARNTRPRARQRLPTARAHAAPPTAPPTTPPTASSADPPPTPTPPVAVVRVDGDADAGDAPDDGPRRRPSLESKIALAIARRHDPGLACAARPQRRG